MQEFKDRVAVVTGAASGIGRAMAKRFLEARNPAAATGLFSDLSGTDG